MGRSGIIIAAMLAASAGAFADEIVLKPGEISEQIILDREPAGGHFDAEGVVVSGGESERFSEMPRFCLYIDLKRNPGAGIGYESTEVLESWELPNEERYPVQIRDLEDPSISGLTVIGAQSPDLPWRVMKAMWDGDALHIKGCRGSAEVAAVYFDNVEDGFGPEPGLEYWHLRDSYMRGIRDDAIENDSLIPGFVENCLIDGCFTFLSQRPDSGEKSDSVTRVGNCLIHIQAQPHDGIPGKAWRNKNIRIGEDAIGRAPGMLFKWGEGTGTVKMENCVVRIDAVSVNGEDDMEFPPGEFKNVTVVWLGEGEYPRRLPEGVTVTRDLKVWEDARDEWIRRVGAGHPAAKVLGK